MTKILIVSSTHGHEKIGQYVSKELQNRIGQNENIDYIIGNPEAEKRNIPFTESDLNRIFPGKEKGNYEEMRAFELSNIVPSYDIAIDMHSTNTTDYGENSMLIVTKLDEATKNIVDIINPPKVLVMQYKNQNNLISNARIGIAFEYGMDKSEKVLNAIVNDLQKLLHKLKIIDNFSEDNDIPKYKTEIFEVYDAFDKTFEGKFIKSEDLINFQLVNKDKVIGRTETGENLVAPEDFYPIMFGENRYTTILGFKARKMI